MEALYWHFLEVPFHGPLGKRLSRHVTTPSCLFIVLNLLGFSFLGRPLKKETGQKKFELLKKMSEEVTQKNS